ncbi:MAG: arginine repressor [Symbiobacteriia bacterium]
MKARRQMKIIELIRDDLIDTQEDLAQRLRAAGIQVTQATVSRDIKELQLLKVPTGDGRYRYAQPEEGTLTVQSERMLRIFRECILGVEHSGAMLVLTTLPATAPGVAEAVDGLRWREIIGTLAGERNVFVVVKPLEAAPVVAERLRGLMA